jgi:hypothetical protein
MYLNTQNRDIKIYGSEQKFLGSKGHKLFVAHIPNQIKN